MQPRGKRADCREGTAMVGISLSDKSEKSGWFSCPGGADRGGKLRETMWQKVLLLGSKVGGCPSEQLSARLQKDFTFSQTVQCKAVQHISHLCPLQANSHLFGNQPHLRIFHLSVCLHLTKPPAWVHVYVLLISDMTFGGV